MASLLERLLGEDEPDEQVDLEARQERADGALRERVDADARGIEACGVTGVAVVNEGPDGEPVVVPVARFSLGEAVDDPDMDLVWDLVGAAVAPLADAFEEVFVRHYDVQFTFDGDGLLEAEECRRVALSTDLVERFVAEPSFGVAELRAAVEERDDIDDEVAPVAWGEARNYADRTNAAVVTGGAAAVAGASAAGASCAGAGAAGAGGGAC
jgi:hypothetical protein